MGPWAGLESRRVEGTLGDRWDRVMESDSTFKFLLPSSLDFGHFVAHTSSQLLHLSGPPFLVYQMEIGQDLRCGVSVSQCIAQL